MQIHLSVFCIYKLINLKIRVNVVGYSELILKTSFHISSHAKVGVEEYEGFKRILKLKGCNYQLYFIFEMNRRMQNAQRRV